ncbi:MAG: hypothetical protein FWD96_01785, partial [Defluviitaleaceae bacterium]|nr:hypothetical protein [Defluviitaleaceae bacterium]
MNYLNEPLYSLGAYNEIAAEISEGRTPVLLSGVIETQKCHIAAALIGERPAIFITASERAAKAAYEDLRYFLRDRVMYYPFKDIIFYSADVKSINITRDRLNVLDALMSGSKPVIVLSVEALFDRLTPQEVFYEYILELAVADEMPIAALAAKLVPMGYERVEMVEAPGQFAVRGGIVDIYTTLYENALRIEFWGDEVDSIRLLDSASQRSIEKLGSVRLFPMREFVYGDTAISSVCKKIRVDLDTALTRLAKDGKDEAAINLRAAIGEHLEKFSQKISFKTADRYINYFYPQANSLLDYLPDDALLFFDEPARLAEHAGVVLEEFSESIMNKIEKGYMMPTQANLVLTYADIVRKSTRFASVLLAHMPRQMKEFSPKAVHSITVRPTMTLRQRIDLLLDDLRHYTRADYRIAILCSSRTRGQRLAQEIADEGLPTTFVDDLHTTPLKPGIVTVAPGSLNKGFE